MSSCNMYCKTFNRGGHSVICNIFRDKYFLTVRNNHGEISLNLKVKVNSEMLDRSHDNCARLCKYQKLTYYSEG